MTEASFTVDPTVPRYKSMLVEASKLSSEMMTVVVEGISMGGTSLTVAGVYKLGASGIGGTGASTGICLGCKASAGC